MNINKKLIYMIIIFLLSLNIEAKEWTIMVYLNGDNSLDEYAFQDFNEIESIGSNDSVDIVIQYDRASAIDYADWSTSKRFYITQDSRISSINSREISDLGEIDSGDYHSVVDFVRWAKTSYPAENYALIIWNHGNGWSRRDSNGSNNSPLTKGISFDDDSGNDISIANGDFENMLSEIKDLLGKKLDFLGLDACLMGMWEISYVSSPYVDYLAFSEELEDATGWQYDTLLTSFNSSNKSAENLCIETVESSINSVGSTLSCVNLNNITELNSALDNFANHFENEHSIDTEILLAYTLALDMDESGHKDLWHFIINLSSRVSQEINDLWLNPILLALENFVVANRNLGDYSEARGVAIYLPLQEEYIESYSNGRWSIETKWDQFIQKDFFFREDEYEPDNSIETATENLDFATQSHSIHNLEDSDYTKYSLKANHIYEFETICNNYDTMIYLFDSNGELIISDDDGGVERCSLIRYRVLEDQIVYLKVQTYSHETVALYNLSIKETSLEDDHPNTISEIREDIDKFENGTAVINYSSDIDFFYIDLVKDSFYIFETIEDDLDDTILYLFNSDGELLFENDDIDKDGKNYLSKIEWKASYSGRYFIAIKAYEGEIGKYSFKVEKDICTPTNSGVEICDNIDNDCNFIVDDNVDCNLSESNSSCIEGECKVLSCKVNFHNIDNIDSNGCEYSCTFTENRKEVCDGIDNNCNGLIDENSDNFCILDNANSICENSNCIIDSCDENFYDINNDTSDGCEYSCSITNGGKEICDKIDNDCNGIIDEDSCPKDSSCAFNNSTKDNNLWIFLIFLSIFYYFNRKIIKKS